ncbi:MAG: hypothetical protein J5J06_09185 [Phycisphaerae bacterium]|nr:hypothetical protein [Phycisphaerae bacterium]
MTGFSALLEGYQANLPHFDVVSRQDSSPPGSRSDSAFVRETHRFKNSPAGFEWYEFYEGNIALLKPEGWYVTQKITSTTKAISISKEEVQPHAGFFTGLSINVISTPSVKPELKASELAMALLLGPLKDFKFEFLSGSDLRPHQSTPGMKVAEVQIRYAPNVHQLFHVVADDERGLVYYIDFVAPDDEWDQAWKQSGFVIMNSIRIARPSDPART